MSVDAVAEAAGRTSGAVYAHFGSKQGLLVALLDEWRHSLVSVIAEAFAHAPSLDERLRAVATSVIVHPSEETSRLLALEREVARLAGRDRPIAAALRARSAEAHSRMARGFAAWMESGLVPRGDPGTVAGAFRALVLGLELQQRLGPVLDVEQVAAMLTLVVGGGAGPPVGRVASRTAPPAIERTRSA